MEPKTSVKIILKKKPPPLPSKLPDDIEDDEKTQPQLPKSAPPSLTCKSKNIIKDIEKELDDLTVDRPIYHLTKFVIAKSKIEQIGNEVLVREWTKRT